MQLRVDGKWACERRMSYRLKNDGENVYGEVELRKTSEEDHMYSRTTDEFITRSL